MNDDQVFKMFHLLMVNLGKGGEGLHEVPGDPAEQGGGRGGGDAELQVDPSHISPPLLCCPYLLIHIF